MSLHKNRVPPAIIGSFAPRITVIEPPAYRCEAGMTQWQRGSQLQNLTCGPLNARHF